MNYLPPRRSGARHSTVLSHYKDKERDDKIAFVTSKLCDLSYTTTVEHRDAFIQWHQQERRMDQPKKMLWKQMPTRICNEKTA
eukprot:7735717-Ditylum_brightwellii.AAC.1